MVYKKSASGYVRMVQLTARPSKQSIMGERYFVGVVRHAGIRQQEVVDLIRLASGCFGV